jgi:holo-[acyl-carrier protein] synthase
MTARLPRIGTDIVSVDRIDRLVRRRGNAFLDRWFTPAEIAYCMGKAHPVRHLAARFAAKEAVVKALGAPWDGPLPWRSVEVVRDSAAPDVRLTGVAEATARDAGIGAIQVSLSHCDEYATAVALAVPA